MARKSKRVLSVLLTLVMIVGLLPTSVFAEDATSGTVEWQKDSWTFSENDGKVAHKKTIEKTGENEFEITLSVKTMEQIKEQAVSEDAAVVLVMDVSNSMKETVDGKEPDDASEQRIYKAREAAKNFIDDFAADDAQRKVALVEFGSSAYTVQGWTDTDSAKSAVDNVGINFEYPNCTIQGSHTHQVNTIKWGGIFNLTWKCTDTGCPLHEGEWLLGGWYPIWDRRYEGHTHEQTFNGPHGETLTDGGGTNIEGGLQLADNLLGSSDISNIKNRYVVLITDGVPTYHVYQGRDNSSLTFIEGQSGGGNHAEWSDYQNVPNVANSIKSKATLYTVSYASDKVKDKVDGKTIDAWLASFANKNVAAGADIDLGLGQISQIIQNQAKAWILRDPIPAANYITFSFDDNEDIPDLATNHDAVFGYDSANRELVWNLKAEIPGEPVEENGVKWYHYETKYTIRLNTAGEGFVEDQPYATNGTTTLSYMLTENGQVNPELQYTNLVVPTVSGKIPEYTYRVEYYLQNEDGKGYTLKDTDYGPKTDLRTTVSVTDVCTNYQTKYDKQNYHFGKGDPLSCQITADPDANVIKIYYDRDTAGVTVNHYYKSKVTSVDNQVTESGSWDTPAVTEHPTGYVGDPFTAEEKLYYGQVKYDLHHGDKTITVSENAADNVINLYYYMETDQRDPASVQVDHVYRHHVWTLKDGKYVQEIQEHKVEKVEESSNLKAYDVYTVENPIPTDEYSDYVYDESSENSKTLKAGKNTITLYFDAYDPAPDTVTITVNHHYTKTTVTIGQDGKPIIAVNPENHIETVTLTPYKGENVTITEENEYGGELYTSDKGNAGKLDLEAVQEGRTVELYYKLYDGPDTTYVTVKHIYRTITHETVVVTDEDGNAIGTKVEDTINEDSEDPVTVSKLYVGQKYTAEKKGLEGYTFNEKASDPLEKEVEAGGATVITLYYDKDEDKDERDQATIDVKHVYTTHLTTIVDGEVKTIDVPDGEVVEPTHIGRVGDTFAAVPVTETDKYDDYTVVGTPKLEVVLQTGTNGTITIYYERSASDLVETSYSVNYVYDTYNMAVTDGVAGYPATPDIHEEVPGVQTVKGYVGQRVTIADGAKPGFVVEGTNPATSQILEEGDNTYTFRYVQRNPLSQVNVTVNHHYTTKTIAVDGTETSSTDVVYGTPVPKYVDETYEATLRLDGFDYERYTVTEGIAAVQDETSKNVTVTATGNVTVDFYYTKTFNNSQPVNYSIQHIYKTIDWDGSVTTSPADPITASSFATRQISAGVDDNGGNFKLVSATFNGEPLADFDAEDPKDAYMVTLVNGENKIVYTYERHVDTRETTKVQVTYNYFARDTYTDDDTMSDADYIAQEGMQPEYTVVEVLERKDQGVWVGHEYTAADKPEYTVGEGDEAVTLTYHFVNSTPEGRKIASLAAMEEGTTAVPEANKIVANYLREYSTDPGDVSYTVVHEYYSNGNFVGHIVDETGIGKVGSTIRAEDITKITSFEGRTYRYRDADPESMVLVGASDPEIMALAADGEENVMTLRYTRTSGGGGGGGSTDPKPDPDPGTDIEEPDVPTTELPEEPTEPVEEPTEIEEPEVPMAEVPETGDSNFAYMHLLSLASAMGLAALFISDKRSKKHRDET